MTQYARPSADVTDGNWLNELASATNLYASIDEVSLDDADYIESEAGPSSSPVVVKLSSVTDPSLSTGHVLNYRYRKDSSGGLDIDITVEVREGYVSEASLGTLITQASHSAISSSFVTGTITLTGAEADTITDYTDLYLRIVANQV